VFIVELTTTTGKVCEHFASYEEARRRVDSIAAEALVGMPLIFQELPDGSQRVVRDDGKPLQWHRLPEEDPPDFKEEPIPLSEGPADLVTGGWRLLTPARPPDDNWDEPLEVIDLDTHEPGESETTERQG